MDEIVFFPSAILALVLIAIHVVRSLIVGDEINLATIVNCVLNAAGIVGGTLLVLSTFIPELKVKMNSLALYIFVAGLAVFFVSGQAVLRELFQRPHRAKRQ